MGNKILENAFQIMMNKKKEIINLNKKGKNKVPTVFYIGMGKTGSQSIAYSLKDNIVAHWHGEKYFNRIYDTNILSNNGYDLYDLVEYIGIKNKFKPLIIECIREPISKLISSSFQHLKTDKADCKCKLCAWKNNDKKLDNYLLKIIKNRVKSRGWEKYICSINYWKKHYNLDILKIFNNNSKYLFIERKNVKLLFLRFEEIEERVNLFKKLKYNFCDEPHNLSHEHKLLCDAYKYVKDNLRFTEKELNSIYNETVKIFYTDEEIKSFKKKYSF